MSCFAAGSFDFRILWRSAALIVLMSGVLPGILVCSSQAQSVQTTDARGTVIRLPQPAQRIITLTPHLTELAFAVDAGDRLVGVARFSRYPPQARRLLVISDAVQFDIERILTLRPDLVLAWQGGTPPEVINRLERIGMPVYVAGAARLEQIAQSMTAIAALSGTLSESAVARAAFSRGLRELRERRYSTAPVRVFYEIWSKPLMTVSNAHVISEIISLCGGINVFGDLQVLTPEVSREGLLAARPEIALGGGSAESSSGFAARWSALPPPLGSVPAHHIAPDLIQQPTPRLLEGARLVCAHLDRVRADRR